MPIITVRYVTSHEVSPEDVASAASAASTSFLRKRADLTAVIAEPVDQSRWFIAGKSLAEHALASFWLEIRIVEGTSTKEERERFITGIFEAMGQLLGPLHHESYVHVHEVRADAYGFGGRTQERRFIEARPLPAVPGAG
ncbi:MAG: 4-oxalocrotonate tautomerase [Mesorhizobium sp.]|uniref:tautomerase family protein n=1 Tax=Mesorhizobium sp. TaxID=1871066 RepID=UPI000FE7CFE4|nr:tautomerase family protein [Mesorhizobium sp.]RWN37812.1 MAG: 4-oxalocrotonate tautomerase [Mesorhizobium sp.]RWN64461.1 MAG: 4-oxalocrotonate tautomerase [Mesorhizobium sp.]